MSGWEFTVNSGNPEVDRTTIETYRQQVASQGMQLQVQPLPTGGYHLRAVPGGGAPAMPQQQQQYRYAPPPAGFAPPAYAGAGAGPGAGAAAGPMTHRRVVYLRKVYGLLSLAAVVAILTGLAVMTLGPTETMKDMHNGKMVEVPFIAAALIGSPFLWFLAFGALFVSTMIAGWVSKVPVVNVIALFFVSALMGLELAPMAFVAQYYGNLGQTMSAAPVRDAFLMTGGIFAGITGYIFTTKKDFSYLKSILWMGFVVVFIACILAAFFQSEIFTLAVCSVGALLAALFLLYETSYIFRNSEMDDPVGDALGLIIQLRNLFMFLLRILMSMRD